MARLLLLLLLRRRRRRRLLRGFGMRAVIIGSDSVGLG